MTTGLLNNGGQVFTQGDAGGFDLGHAVPAQDEEATTIEQAAQRAEQARDWDLAARHWFALRAVASHGRAAEIGYANALLRLDQAERADRELAKAPEDYHDHLDFLVALAVNADHRMDLAASLARWSRVRGLFPDFSYAHAAVTAVLYAQTNYDEAETIIAAAWQRFPDDADILVHATNVAVARNMWQDAATRLNHLVKLAPNHPYLHNHDLHEIIRAGLEQDQLDNFRRVSESAKQAERLGAWRQAGELWTQLRHSEVFRRDSILGRGRSARELMNFAEADEILSAASSDYPADAEIFANYAQVASNALDWTEAARRWSAGLRRFPELDVCCNMSAEALRQTGALAEAEQQTAKALLKYPDRLDIHVLHATIAQDAGRWNDAVQRWEAIARILPDDAVIRDARGRAMWHAGLQKSETGIARGAPAAPRAAATSAAADDTDGLKQLMLAFEGLGDNCEFGMVQRHFGAEPLGLLRFSGIRPQLVADLLGDRFTRLGDPAHTRLHEAPDGSFLVEDDRGFYRMHTFLKREEIKPDQLLAQQIKRLNFLKRELIEDLSAGTKSFVCKETERAISDEMLQAISAQLRCYGDNLLVGIRLADADHAAGSVECITGTILVGYVAGMYTQDPASYANIDFTAWRKILQTAYRYKVADVNARRSVLPGRVTP